MPLTDSGKRNDMTNKYLADIEKITQEVDDDEAYEILSFITFKAAKPNELGAQVLSRKETDSIMLIPLLEQDKTVGEKWREVFQSDAVANFLPDIQGIAVKEYIPYSSLGRSLAVLHEAFHARAFLQDPYEIQSDQEYCKEEVQAHMFQHKLMAKLGGEKYQKLLDKEVERITASEKLNGVIPFPTDYAELSEVLGHQPASVEEKRFIANSFWTNSVFVFLERSFPKEAAELKSGFIMALFARNWTL